MSARQLPGDAKCWYVMRDLKRANAKLPAYKQLQEKQIEVFTPLKWCLVDKQGKKVREQVPFIRDLLFVHDSRSVLDPIIERTPTLQYRYVRGGGYCEPMVVLDNEMDKFMHAVSSTDNYHYYRPDEITKEMCGRRIRIIGGLLDGYEGNLLKVRGSKIKYLLVELGGLLSVGVEVKSEYIQFI